jgi:hypothetical protein
MCRFNLSAQELRANVLEPWARDRWVEFGERKWIPHQATLTVLEGPRIPFAQLTMGRGWRAAQREGREVTEELLAALASEPAPANAHASGVAGDAGDERAPRVSGQGLAARVPGATGADASAEDLAADSLGLELLARIGSERAPLRRAWDLAGERHPGSPPSATLALAERAVESLLRGRLIVLSRGAAADGDGGDAPPLDEGEVERVLAAVESWTGAEGRAEGGAGVWMRRA